jgi:hypothetical protein
MIIVTMMITIIIIIIIIKAISNADKSNIMYSNVLIRWLIITTWKTVKVGCKEVKTKLV